ncbi:Pvc16 family protein [Bradyrhizobium sp. JYMT SZCCT0180]|uniref:DUF4255 domain-containing protein n=1 Tax=Bradyrhizobium sp. JYMT SZCCT0180 TaxID=2807666 RepID=UPI001BAA00C6|nr:Pvc16 family protein [Bradyrhizobium sp. JYMT SZCCT0180]MBR1214643.1 DUF4255 domain-containing protein [Bradyrhizobium sp. JYMT SZCCT0180]
MSNADAIATVTGKLRAKLSAASKVWVSTNRLDDLPPADHDNALNLHLYQISPNANWRNMDVPWKAKPGEPYQAPLALDLHYLLTATSAEQAVAQKSLGAGMRALHDDPFLDPGEGAVAPFERARITMHPLSLDEMEKLWAGVLKPRKLSVAYEVSVVLIESERPVRSASPVLRRGTGSPDSIAVQPNLQSLPEIERIEIGKKKFDEWLRRGSRPGRAAAEIDDTIFIYGQGLSKVDAVVIESLRHPVPDTEKPMVIDKFTTNDRGALVVDLSETKSGDKPVKIPAGPCSIALRIKRKDSQTYLTNAVPFSVAPKIISSTKSITIPDDVSVTFDPPLVGNQVVALIFGERQLLPTTKPAEGVSSLIFRLEGLKPPKGPLPIRLRVDGVDSFGVNSNAEDGSPNLEQPFLNVITVT